MMELRCFSAPRKRWYFEAYRTDDELCSDCALEKTTRQISARHKSRHKSYQTVSSCGVILDLDSQLRQLAEG